MGGRRAQNNILLALSIKGYPLKADIARMNKPKIVFLLVVMMIYVCMVYGPMAAFLVDLFPARIRYTSLSLPYHLGNGWFGGMLPLVATAMVAASGNIYYGLVVSRLCGGGDLRRRAAVPARPADSGRRAGAMRRRMALRRRVLCAA